MDRRPEFGKLYLNKLQRLSDPLGDNSRRLGVLVARGTPVLGAPIPGR